MDNLSKSIELTEFQFHGLTQAADSFGLLAVYEEAHTEEEKEIVQGHMAAMETLVAAGLLTEVTHSFAVAVYAHKRKTGFGYRAWCLTDDAVTMFRSLSNTNKQIN